MLQFNDVTKEYSGVPVLHSVTVGFQLGKVYALVGPNGSGKTTLMKLAANLIKPRYGTITLNGQPISNLTNADIAYMPTEPYFYDFMTIAQLEQFYVDFYDDFDREHFSKLIAYMQLTGNLKIKALSSGMHAKLKIAATMARRAKVIMLDEPLNGIDLIARDEVIGSIINSTTPDCCIIVSSHLFEELEPIVDNVLMLRSGHIILSGAIDEIREKTGKSIADLYREIYGNPAPNPFGAPQFSGTQNTPFNQPPQNFPPNENNM